MIKIVAVPYSSLPCAEQSLSVNGIAGYKDDFGSNTDLDPYNAEDYACGDNQFVPYEGVDPEVLAHYRITEEQYREVQDRLGTIFCVGSCGWCV